MVFDLVVQANEEERAHGTEFRSPSSFDLEPPVFVVLCHRWATGVTDNENGREVNAHGAPQEHIEPNHQLPSETKHDGQSQPKEKVGQNQRRIQQPHLGKPVFLGFEWRGYDVLEAVVPHQVTDQRRDHRPEHVGLHVLLEELSRLAAGVVFLFREGQGPRVDVRVPSNDVGMSVMLHVVLVAPVLHGKPRKKRKSEGGQRKVARLRFAG